MRGSVLSLSFVEPLNREKPKKPDAPDPRHAPRNGFGRRLTSGNSEYPRLFFRGKEEKAVKKRLLTCFLAFPSS